MTNQEKIKDIERIIDKLLLESYGQVIPNDVINYLKEYQETLSGKTNRIYRIKLS